MTEFLLPATVAAVLLAVVLAALAAFSLRDFSRSRLEKLCRASGHKARFSTILKRHEDALLATDVLLVVLTLLFAALTLSWLNLPIPSALGPADWMSFLTKAILLLLFTTFAVVIVPWSISRVAGEKFLCRYWPLLAGLLAASKPLLSLARKIDTYMHRLSGLREPSEGDASTLTEEIRTVIDEGQREGVLESQARTMIHRVMELQEEDVAAIMTPRTEMNCIQAGSTLEEARARLLEVGHTRVPVIGDTTDDIIGTLYAKDLLKHVSEANGQSVTLADIVREPLYVPETTGIDTLLETMKREHVHLAVVIDEYSGVSGLVTLEDVLEEIVGEIVDEYDSAEETGIHDLGSGAIEVDARVHIDDLNEQFSYNLPEDGDFDTIGGFVLSELGRIPQARDDLTWQQLRITVLDADKRKINKLRIEVDASLAARAGEES